jgi:hypothetical protein
MTFRIALLASACTSLALAEVRVATEQIGTQRADWNKPAWEFKTIHKPSTSAASRSARITIVGKAEPSCLAPGALANGVMPQQTRLRRDFFAFANGTNGGLIVMDLGQVTPVSEINSYSAHGPVGGTTWAEEFDGVRGPQVYVLFGSAPDTEALARQTRPKLAAVESLDSHLRLWALPRPDLRPQLATARERSLMYGEHTWGSAKNLEGRNAYALTNFARFVKTDATGKFLESTWADHAGYIRKAAEIADQLGGPALSQLASNVAVAGPRAVVFNPLPHRRDALVEINGLPIYIKDLPPGGYKTIALPSAMPTRRSNTDRTALENAFLRVTVDRAKGGVVSIVEKSNGRELVDPAATHAFGQYFIEKFDRKQLDAYQIGCVHLDTVYGANAKICAGWNIRADLPATPAYATAAPVYSSMAVRKNGAVQEAVLTAAPAGIIESRVTTTITLADDAPWLEIAVRLDDKQPNYWPEAGSLVFPVNAAHPQFRIGRLGGVVDPVTDFAPGSNRTYGYVNTGAMIAGDDGRGVALCPLDHGIMSLGDKGIGTIAPGYAPSTPVARVSLFNNFWTTNFRYWIQGTICSRVRVWSTANLDPSSLTGPALEARQPVLVGMADGPAGKLPAEQTGLMLSRPNIQVVAFARNPDGPGMLLRVWEQGGQSGNLTVTLPGKFSTATPVSLRSEKLGETGKISDSKFSFNLPAYSPASFVLE